MSKQPKWIERAMNLAIRRARYENASLQLPGTGFGGEDTEAIREATRLYVESWLIPLLRAVRDDNRGLADALTRGEDCSDPTEKSKPEH